MVLPEAPASGPVLRFLRAPFDRSVDALEPIVTAERPLRVFALLGVSLVASWYLYVPVHELLHATGCAWTGGTVTTLEVQEQYGGALLARWLDFVEPGGEYAGRLSGFDTHGSDLVYLSTDALPFALSVLLGPLLLRIAARGCRPVVAAPGFVLGLAPFYNVPGDYFEMGGILATHFLDTRWHVLRADDVFRLLGKLAEGPAAVGLDAGDAGMAWGLVVLSAGLAVALAYATWGLGDWLAGRLVAHGEPHGGEAESRDD